MSQTFKILMVAACPFPANHGSPASIREMSEELIRKGHEVHVVTYPDRDQEIETNFKLHRVMSWRSIKEYKNAEIKVGPSFRKFLYNPLMVLKTIRLIKKYNIDVIHAHNYEGLLIALLAKVFINKPILYNAVNSMKDELPTYDFFSNKKLAEKLARILDSQLPKRADYISAVSHDLINYLIENEVNEDKIKYIPAGVNCDDFTIDKNNAPNIKEKRTLVSLKTQGKTLISYTGSYDRFQRLDYLVDLLVAINDANIIAVILNNIPNEKLKNELLTYAEEKGVRDQLVCIDNIPFSDLKHYMDIVDITLITRPECPGHPVKVLNYMASKKPIVGFVGGAKGISNEVNGLVSENHDIKGLAASIQRLIEDKTLAKQLAARAYNDVINEFSWNNLTEGYLKIYKILSPRENLREGI